MEKNEFYPDLSKSIWIILLYCFVFVAIPYCLLRLLSLVVKFSINDPLFNMISTGLGLGLMILWIKRKNKLSLKNLLGFKGLTFKQVISIILLIIGSSIILSEADNLFKTILPLNSEWKNIFSGLFEGKFGLWKSILATAIGAPVIEEILFRGVILKGLLKHYSPIKAIFFNSLIFGISHMNPWQFLSAFVGGVILGWLFYKTHSLIPCILGHSLNNSLPYITTNLLHIKIPGYNFGNSFQPVWFNLLGIILCISGSILLHKIFNNKFGRIQLDSIEKSN